MLLLAKEGDDRGLCALLERSADVNATDDEGVTSLMFAASHGHVSTVLLLLSKGAIVDQACIYGTTAILFAAGHGHADVVRMLIDHGASIDTVPTDTDQMTALIKASWRGHTAVVNILL